MGDDAVNKELLIIDFDVLAQVISETRAVKAGEVIFSAGDPDGHLFVVRDGSVAIRLGDKLVERVGPSQVFGEMAVVDHGPRSATAVAEVDSVIVPVSEAQFLALVQEAPYFALEVMRVLVRRIRSGNAGAKGA